MQIINKILLSIFGVVLIAFGPSLIRTLYGTVSIPLAIFIGIIAIAYMGLIWSWPKPLLVGYKDSLWGDSESDVYGLKSELTRKIAPNNYMQPYDSIKMATAVALLDKLKKTEYSNLAELKNIRLIAEKELGLQLNAGHFSNHIIKVLVPLNFSKDTQIAEKANIVCEKVSTAKCDINAIEDTLEEFQKEIVLPSINSKCEKKLIIKKTRRNVLLAYKR